MRRSLPFLHAIVLHGGNHKPVPGQTSDRITPFLGGLASPD
jgi:hypothetical protein